MSSPTLSQLFANEATSVPLCYIVDDDISVRHFISAILQGAEIDTREFASGQHFREAIAARVPDLVFLDVPLQNADVMESMAALGSSRYRGYVQLMSNRGTAVMETTKHIGERNKLAMLPVLKKPFELPAIQKILAELKIGTPSGAVTRINLHEALEQGWAEFWYQPKIDLRTRTLVGAEALARVRHPQHGILSQQAFMPGADAASIASLSLMGIEAAVKAGSYFAQLGVHLTLSTAVPLETLKALPLSEIFKQQRRELGHWPGLVINIAEKQVADDPDTARALIKRITGEGIKVSVHGAGRSVQKLAEMRDLPLTEVKLDRSIVTDCGIDKGNAAACKSVIDVAHSMAADAVACGIEKVADVLALYDMACDCGEGNLFAHPMSRERFTAILRQRAPENWLDTLVQDAREAQPA